MPKQSDSHHDLFAQPMVVSDATTRVGEEADSEQTEPVELTGSVRKMRVHAQPLEGQAETCQVHYQLSLGDQTLVLNPRLGQQVRLEWQGAIHCVHCARTSRKSFGQGYCYPCFSRLAQCDSCMMSPEKCHFHMGTCREPEWAESVCFQPHYVYLANSSGIKVGITRESQVPTRWMDQGAVQALCIARVSSRRLSGLVEDTLRQQVPDKTNWRNMLKGNVEELELRQEAEQLWEQFEHLLEKLPEQFGDASIDRLTEGGNSMRFVYPVLEYPTKVSSHNLDKTNQIEGRLMGIKGQYLILDNGVINLRKYSGYDLKVSFSH